MTSEVKNRRKTIPVKVGRVMLGGNHPIAVQSMLKHSLRDTEKMLKEAHQVEQAGVEILRVAIPTEEDASLLKLLKKEVQVPLVADIHFNPRIALKALEAGADKLRLNPGNTKSGPILRQIVREAKQKGASIRIGVNAGSLPPEFYIRYADQIPKAMVETVLFYIRDFEEEGFDQIVISMKSSRVMETIAAYRMMASQCPYPFHLGVTEAGSGMEAIIKSAIGLGVLLEEGIGDTLRVSLAGPAVEEVQAGFEILKALGLREKGFDLIACPGCGRLRVDVEFLSQQVKKVLKELKAPEQLVRIAVMGCEVNGPGESRMADLGIAGGVNTSTLYFKGKKVERVPNSQLEAHITEWVKSLVNESDHLKGIQ